MRIYVGVHITWKTISEEIVSTNLVPIQYCQIFQRKSQIYRYVDEILRINWKFVSENLVIDDIDAITSSHVIATEPAS